MRPRLVLMALLAPCCTLPSTIVDVTVLAGAKDFAASLDLTAGPALSASFAYASAAEASDKRAHVLGL